MIRENITIKHAAQNNNLKKKKKNASIEGYGVDEQYKSNDG